jgi:hypothetical protein
MPIPILRVLRWRTLRDAFEVLVYLRLLRSHHTDREPLQHSLPIRFVVDTTKIDPVLEDTDRPEGDCEHRCAGFQVTAKCFVGIRYRQVRVDAAVDHISAYADNVGRS